jgi:hypothetical protein
MRATGAANAQQECVGRQLPGGGKRVAQALSEKAPQAIFPMNKING